jgi:small subunit ribosomal protein S17
MARETRKKRQGRVVRNTMDKTVIVAVEWRQRHPLYKKSVRRITKFFAHDGENKCRLGDVVRIEETRPISRMKRWRVVQILERHEVAEVKPIELDQPVLEEVSDTEAVAAAVNGAGSPEILTDLAGLGGLEDMDDGDALLFAELEREQREVTQLEGDEDDALDGLADEDGADEAEEQPR